MQTRKSASVNRNSDPLRPSSTKTPSPNLSPQIRAQLAIPEFSRLIRTFFYFVLHRLDRHPRIAHCLCTVHSTQHALEPADFPCCSPQPAQPYIEAKKRPKPIVSHIISHPHPRPIPPTTHRALIPGPSPDSEYRVTFSNSGYCDIRSRASPYPCCCAPKMMLCPPRDYTCPFTSNKSLRTIRNPAQPSVVVDVVYKQQSCPPLTNTFCSKPKQSPSPATDPSHILNRPHRLLGCGNSVR